MANETELNIILKLIDNATSPIQASMAKASNSIKSFSEKARESGLEMRKLGKEISQVGTALAFFGAGVSGIFIKALNDASKSSDTVQSSLNRLGQVANEFQTVIATAVVPIVDKFTNLLENLLRAINSISQPLRDKILQYAFMGAILITLTGTLVLFIGKMIQLAGVLRLVTAQALGWVAANIAILGPIALVVAAIAGLIFLMYKFKPVADTAISAFEVLFLFLKNGFLTVKAANELFVASVLGGVANILAGLAKIPGPSQEAFTNMANAMETASANAQILAERDLYAIEQNAQKIDKIFKTGSGDWSAIFQEMKVQIEEAGRVFDDLKNKPTEFDIALRQIKDNIKIVMADLGNVAKQVSSTITGSVQKFSSGFGQAFAGMLVEGKSFSEQMKAVFKDLVSYIIAEFAKLAAIKLIQVVLGKFFHGGGEVEKKHSGGIIRAHEGLAVDEVPIIAQTGEGILSRRGMNALGGSGNLARLNNGQSINNSTGDINVNVYYPKMSDQEEVKNLANVLGLEIQRQLRYARGF